MQLNVTGTGGTASASVSFTLQTAAPTKPVVHLDTNADPTQTGRIVPTVTPVNVVIQGTTTPGASVSYFSGTATSAKGTTTASASGDFSFPETLTNGPNDFTFIATDTAGNESQTQATYVVDRPPTGTVPNVTVTFPAANQILDLAADFTDPDTSNSILQFNTTQGVVNVTLADGQSPQTVANFLDYVKSGRLDSTIFHRLASGFVLQGGGFTLEVAPTSIIPVTTGPSVKNEFPTTVPAGGVNTRGTLAMAKFGSDPNSATSQYFFNLANNTANLDAQNGGFTVFAQIADGFSQRIVDNMSSITPTDESSAKGTAINEIQHVVINGSPTGGSFTLNLAGTASTAIPFNATASQVAAAIAALPAPSGTGTIGSANISVTGSAGTFDITFKGTLAGTSVAQLTSFSNLVGGNLPSVTVTTTTPGQATNSALNQLPLTNYTGSPATFPTDATAANFETVNSIKIIRNTEFLKYTITNNTNPGVALASLDPTFNNRLTLQFLNPGATAQTTSITVVATDLSNQSVTSTFTVTVNPSSSTLTPTIAAQTFTASANSPNGTAVGKVQAAGQALGTTITTYAITAGNTNSAFAIDTHTGQITVADHTQLDIATHPTFTLTVQVTDSASQTSTGTVTIKLVANTAPSIADQTFQVAAGTIAGTIIGTVAASGANGQAVTYAITNGDGTFAINSTTGQLSVANETTLNSAPNSAFDLIITVSDANNPALSGTATIAINRTANSPPTVTANQFFNVTANSAGGTIVGTVAATDPDPGQTRLFAITGGNGAGNFQINNTTGQITVSSGPVLVAGTVFTLLVTATDNDSTPLTSAPTAVTIAVVVSGYQPSITGGQTFSAVDGSPVGTSVGTVVASNPNGNPFTYSITAGNNNNTFQIDPNTGHISVANNAQLTRALFTTFTLTVQVTDAGFPHPVNAAAVTINVTTNTAPTITAQAFSVPHTSPVGFTFGPVVATDPDPGQTISHYAITAGNTGNTFTIDPSSGILKVADTTDLTTAHSPFNLTVTVEDTDARPLFKSAVVTVTVT